MKVFSCRKAFIEDKFVENVNVFVLEGKSPYGLALIIPLSPVI